MTRHDGHYVLPLGPSNHPDLAAWLIKQGITSISLNPDTVVDTWRSLGGVSAPQ